MQVTTTGINQKQKNVSGNSQKPNVETSNSLSVLARNEMFVDEQLEDDYDTRWQLWKSQKVNIKKYVHIDKLPTKDVLESWDPAEIKFFKFHCEVAGINLSEELEVVDVESEDDGTAAFVNSDNLGKGKLLQGYAATSSVNDGANV